MERLIFPKREIYNRQHEYFRKQNIIIITKKLLELKYYDIDIKICSKCFRLKSLL